MIRFRVTKQLDLDKQANKTPTKAFLKSSAFFTTAIEKPHWSRINRLSLAWGYLKSLTASIDLTTSALEREIFIESKAVIIALESRWGNGRSWVSITNTRCTLTRSDWSREALNYLSPNTFESWLISSITACTSPEDASIKMSWITSISQHRRREPD